MTPEDAHRLKDPEQLPWNEPCCVFVPGRYYHSLNFIRIPNGKAAPNGADVITQFWRYDATPNEWIMTQRFRYYVTEGAWDGKDRKSWYACKFAADAIAIEGIIEKILNTIAGATGLYHASHPPEIHRLAFNGNSEQATEIMMREKPFWMHMKTKEAT